MATCAIVGVNWGDEGKGRMVDYFADRYDIVVRYQGGNNAGHTVVNDRGVFKLNLIPSGIFRPETVNILGNGVVVDLEHLCGEIGRLQEAGIEISPRNLKISDRAIVVFPYHRLQDGLEENRLKDAAYGSTRRGIAPVYGDKYMKKAVMMGELFHEEALRSRLQGILEWKNLTLTKVYGSEALSFEEIWSWLQKFGGLLKPYVQDTGKYLRQAVRENRKILFEAQLGALRDIDFGIYPYTSSSTPLAAYAPIGAGIPGARVDETIGIVKAYSSCVGEGPFTAEWFGQEAEALREAGGEYGAATGRPRRVGPFDVVATRYGAAVQGATSIALTKLDVLSYMEKIPVCVRYELDGQEMDDFPFVSDLRRAKPVMEYLPGWQCDIGKVRRFEDLPQAAREYVLYIEKAVGCPVEYVSVGAERESLIVR